MEQASSPTAPSANAPARTAEELFYAELHRIARKQLQIAGDASLSATTLLHETYLDLRERDPASFPDRGRFVAYAARAMRGRVIDHARMRHAQKRGAGFHPKTLDTQVEDPRRPIRKRSRRSATR